jgi:uncharacterized membrane protein
MRFGHGTWAGIIAERARRIQKAKEEAAAANRKRIQEAKEFEESMKNFILAIVIAGVSIGLFVFLFTVVL